ncbi:MAG: lysylphosphatidylglycerol synthase transmembrane domain-containing protein [Candidatus Cloacimonadaceae bacterium]
MLKELSLNKKEKSVVRKRIGFALKLLLTALMLWFVFRRLDPATIRDSVASLPLPLMLGIILISALRHYIQYLNWFCALKMNLGVKFKRKEVMASYLIAQPLRFAIPGGSASFAKIFYLENSSVFASFIATSTERLFLTWATWSFASITYLCLFTTHLLLFRLGLVVLLVFIPLWAAFIISLVPKTKKYLPGYLNQAPKMMLLQIANTLLMYLQYFLLLNRFVKIDAIETWLSMSLTNISNSIPITISGLGLREGFAMHFLADYGFNAEQAVAVTLSLFVFHDVIIALVGAGVLLTSPAKQKRIKQS